MPIKQIQLRGISRTPSDRMTADGGLAESLNVHLDENEQAPTLPPDDVTAELGVPTNMRRPFVFIHKGNGYTNYITFVKGYQLGAYLGLEWEFIAELESEETFMSASSIGNTLIVMSDKHSHYALFKDGHYIYLGNKIPMPTISLTPSGVSDDGAHGHSLHGGTERERYTLSGGGTTYTTPDHFMPLGINIDKESWNAGAQAAELEDRNYVGCYLGENKTDPTVQRYETFLSLAQERITNYYEHAKELKCFVNQVFAMYAIRLYNETYICSVPVLMPGGFESPFFFQYVRNTTGVTRPSENDDFEDNREYFRGGARFPYKNCRETP